jgi:hypothetical protein
MTIDENKNIIYKELQASGRWFEFSLMEQLANIGCDLERHIRWRDAGELEKSRKAFEAVLELLDLTIRDPKNKKQMDEIIRTRETLIDHFMHDNKYNTTQKQWQDYFYQCNYAAALQRGR